MVPVFLGSQEPPGSFLMGTRFTDFREGRKPSIITRVRTGKKSFREGALRVAYHSFMGAVLTKKPLAEKKSLFLWFFLSALLLSLLAHLLIFERARTWRVTGFAPEEYDEIVPRTFRMKRVEIDPATLEESPKEPVKKTAPLPVRLEKETPTAAVTSSAQAEDILAKPKEIVPMDKPSGATDSSGTLDLGKGMGLEMGIEKEGKEPTAIPLPDNAKEGALLARAMDEKISAAEAASTRATGVGERGAPGFSSLDELLAGNGKVTPATAPILMPTDLLFEYDSATLRPEAARSLTKLGSIIERNTGSSFRIEGHTDSFGGDGYNMGLSTRRAEEVKAWLAKNMGIDPARITTAGFGKSRLLVPGTGNIADQQLNRRVEIVITTRQP